MSDNGTTLRTTVTVDFTLRDPKEAEYYCKDATLREQAEWAVRQIEYVWRRRALFGDDGGVCLQVKVEPV